MQTSEAMLRLTSDESITVVEFSGRTRHTRLFKMAILITAFVFHSGSGFSMSHSLSRREFLQHSSACVASGAAVAWASTAAADKKGSSVTDNVPIVDTHHHLWDLELFNLPWLQNGGPKTLNRSFVMKDYRAADRRREHREDGVHGSQRASLAPRKRGGLRHQPVPVR